jgi:hypothetical protein
MRHCAALKKSQRESNLYTKNVLAMQTLVQAVQKKRPSKQKESSRGRVVVVVEV